MVGDYRINHRDCGLVSTRHGFGDRGDWSAGSDEVVSATDAALAANHPSWRYLIGGFCSRVDAVDDSQLANASRVPTAGPGQCQHARRVCAARLSPLVEDVGD